MRLTNDDALFQVDGRYLGPNGKTWPVHIRYICYGIGAGVLLGLAILLHFGRVRMTVMIGAYTLFLTVVITTSIGNRVDHERPARTLAVNLAHEVGTPRPPETLSAVILTTVKVRPGYEGRVRERQEEAVDLF